MISSNALSSPHANQFGNEPCHFDHRPSHEVRSLFAKRFPNRVMFDEPLSRHLACQVGGPADILVFPQDEDELRWIADITLKERLPVFVVANGTNIIVVDEGLRGITVSVANGFKQITVVQQEGTSVLVRVGAGVEKTRLLDWAIGQGYTGLEFSAGIPGTVGGGVLMNAGTKYGCYGDIIHEVRVFDFKNGVKTVANDGGRFGYRDQSIISHDNSGIVVSAILRLTHGEKDTSLLKVNTIIRERAQKQPLEHPSCGSTFKNPVGLSAGRLIEQAGLKGKIIGGAEISNKHANFILNKGGATARDILSLIDVTKNIVKSKFGVDLECEVVIMGNKNP